MSIFTQILGYIGAICIAIFSAPQLIRVIKTKDTYSVPLLMFSILAFGSICFTIQGTCNILISSDISEAIKTILPVTLANLLSFVFSFSVLSIKLIYIFKARKNKITEKQYCLELACKKGK